MNSTFSSEEFSRYARQIKLQEVGILGQEKLKKARVLCIGLGGLGSPLTLYLAAAGVGTLGLVDKDAIELSNLQRQILYETKQVGYSKTKAAKAKLLAFNPNLEVQTYEEKISRENVTELKELIKSYDLVADCTDNFATRYLIHDTCLALRKPYAYASVSQFQGYCSLFLGDGGPCLHCVFPRSVEQDCFHSCGEDGVLGVSPGVLGTLQATEIIKWILGVGQSLEGRLLKVDFLKMEFKTIHLVKNPDCVCF